MSLVDKIIKEAYGVAHFEERVNQRLLKSQYAIAIDKNGQYSEVGTYTLPKDFQADIFHKLYYLDNFNFDRAKSYAIILGTLKIDRKDIKFKSPKAEEISKNYRLVLYDKESDTHGDTVYVIVKENTLVTTFWGLSYAPDSLNRMHVQKVINIKSMMGYN